jgi:hydroxymethylbilane synthase
VAQSTEIILRLGTRGSPLALFQANLIRKMLCDAHGREPEQIAIEVIRTSGDRIQDRPLADAGGKGLFTKEIEEALIAGAIDLAVHSSKDMPTELPPRLVLAAFPEREDPRDAFISRKAKSMASLPQGASIGTASLRRAAMAKRLRPDLVIVPLRGNVETRLRKLDEGVSDATLLDEGVADATLLALAGLKRLGLTDAATAVLSEQEFLPAVGQGAIGIETRADDARTRGMLAAINHADTFAALASERAFLKVLDGSCRTPIGGHATITGGKIRFRGMIVRPDGSEAFEAMREGGVGDAETLGADAGAELKRRAGSSFFSV